MKNIFIIFILMFILIGCDDGYKNGGTIGQSSGEDPKIKTVKIDGCDYLAFQTSYGYWNYTLKGNGNCGQGD